MPKCTACGDHIDEGADTHVRAVKPMEWDRDADGVDLPFCSVACLLDAVRE